MRDMANESNDEAASFDTTPVQKDFTAEDLCILKAMFLELEKAIDAIQITRKDEGETFPGSYIFDLLGKADVSTQLLFFKITMIE